MQAMMQIQVPKGGVSKGICFGVHAAKVPKIVWVAHASHANPGSRSCTVPSMQAQPSPGPCGHNVGREKREGYAILVRPEYGRAAICSPLRSQYGAGNA